MPQLTGFRRYVPVALIALAACGDDAQTDEETSAVASTPATVAMDWAGAVQRCMADRGWSIEVMEDGGVFAEYPPGQEESGRADLQECGEAATPPLVPMTDEQLSDFYEALALQIDCLRAASFPYDDLPSREQYISSGGAWAQFGGYSSPEQVTAARSACPDPTPT